MEKTLWQIILIVTISCSAAFAAETPRPNILLICVDDLKPALGCYGDALAKTPNVDKLATRGVRFDMAYCNQAVCSPSRNALLVGLRSETLGIYDLATNFRKARPDAITLPQYFKQHGYRTEAIGKLFHVGHGNSEDPASWSVPHARGKGVDYAMTESQAPQGETRGTAYESADVPDSTYRDGGIADEAIQRLRAAKDQPDQPFFLAIGFIKPHLPFNAPKKYWDMHDPAQFKPAERQSLPDGAPDYAGHPSTELRNYRDMPKEGDIPPDLQRTLIHGYYAATSYMDAQLGRVLDTLDETGLSNNTLIVFWGDHGWHLGDHGIWCKHTNYEQAARIPFIVAAPGMAGTVTKSLVESVDLYPTLCELANLPTPTGLDGQSFAAVLKNPAAKTKDSILHVYPRRERLGRAVRTERYRLVEWKVMGNDSEPPVLELYDYQQDPLETANLAAKHPQVVAELSAILAKQPAPKPQVRGAAAGNRSRQDRTAMFNRRDTDRDGKLTRAEFLEAQPDPDQAPARFKSFDINNDETLTKEEFITSGGKNPGAK